MQKSSIILIALAAILVQCEAKVFTRCGLVKELRKQGFPESKLRNWVCLVEAESSRNTALIHSNTNGSKDHGLFQINDKYWCNNSGTAGKDCNLTCAQVRTDDITKASTCAKKIYNRHGFSAWYGWKNKCQGNLPVISNC